LFQEKAKVLITKIQKQKKQVILVGGSNLYINALIYNYDLSATKRDETFDQLTTKQLYEKVWSYSKDIANKNQNNRRRLIRALQILNQNKTLIKRNTVLFDSIIIECYLPRDVLYEKINANTLTMYRGG
jgi:tRNA dimethylallyltransferase